MCMCKRRTMSSTTASEHPQDTGEVAVRTGKWTPEEVNYCDYMIYSYESGALDLNGCNTLREYLAKALNCNPMRITKKYKGYISVARRTPQILSNSPKTVEFVRNVLRHLETLRNSWYAVLPIEELRALTYVNQLTRDCNDDSQQPDSTRAKMVIPATVDSPGRLSSVPQYSNSQQSRTELFDEPYIRCCLQQHVRSCVQVESIVMWLKEVLRVTESRPFCYADIEHSIYTGQISVSGLLSIVSSNCIYNQGQRLVVLHGLIHSYLEKLASIGAGASHKSITTIETPSVQTDREGVTATENYSLHPSNSTLGVRRYSQVHDENSSQLDISSTKQNENTIVTAATAPHDSHRTQPPNGIPSLRKHQKTEMVDSRTWKDKNLSPLGRNNYGELCSAPNLASIFLSQYIATFVHTTRQLAQGQQRLVSTANLRELPVNSSANDASVTWEQDSVSTSMTSEW